MGVVFNLGQRQHRGNTGIAAGEYALPFVAGAGGNDLPEMPRQYGPPPPVVLRGQLRRIEAELAHEFSVKALLDGADREPLAVLGLIHVVPGRTAIEDVDAALI